MENTNEAARENEGSWSNQESCGHWGGGGCALGQCAGSRGRGANVHPESREGENIPVVTDRSSSRSSNSCQRGGGRKQRRWTQKFPAYFHTFFFLFC